MSDAAPPPWVRKLALPSGEWRCLVGLWGFARFDSAGPAKVWPTRATLAEETGQKPAAVAAQLRKLAARGLIRRCGGLVVELVWASPESPDRLPASPDRRPQSPTTTVADPTTQVTPPTTTVADPRRPQSPQNFQGTSNTFQYLADDTRGREALPFDKCGFCTVDCSGVTWVRRVHPDCLAHRDFEPPNPGDDARGREALDPFEAEHYPSAVGASSIGFHPDPHDEHTPHGNADTQPHPQQNHAGACRGRERGRLGAQPQVPNVDLGAVPTGQPGDVRDLPAHVEAVQARATRSGPRGPEDHGYDAGGLGRGVAGAQRRRVGHADPATAATRRAPDPRGATGDPRPMATPPQAAGGGAGVDHALPPELLEVVNPTSWSYEAEHPRWRETMHEAVRDLGLVPADVTKVFRRYESSAPSVRPARSQLWWSRHRKWIERALDRDAKPQSSAKWAMDGDLRVVGGAS